MNYKRLIRLFLILLIVIGLVAEGPGLVFSSAAEAAQSSKTTSNGVHIYINSGGNKLDITGKDWCLRDGLHFTRKGYKVWTSVIRPALYKDLVN